MRAKLLFKEIPSFRTSMIEYQNDKDLTRGSFIIKLWVDSKFKETRLQHQLKQFLLSLKYKYEIGYHIVDVSGPVDRDGDVYYLKIDIALQSTKEDGVENIFDLVIQHAEEKIGDSMRPDYVAKRYLKKVKPPIG